MVKQEITIGSLVVGLFFVILFTAILIGASNCDAENKNPTDEAICEGSNYMRNLAVGFLIIIILAVAVGFGFKIYFKS